MGKYADLFEEAPKGGKYADLMDAPEGPNRAAMALKGALTAVPGAATISTVADGGDGVDRASAIASDVANAASLVATGGIPRALGALGVGALGGAALGSVADKIGEGIRSTEDVIGKPYGLIETNLPSKVAGIEGAGTAINALTRVPRAGMETVIEAAPAALLMAFGLRAPGSRMIKAPVGQEAEALAKLSRSKFGAPVPKIEGSAQGEVWSKLLQGRKPLGEAVGGAKEALAKRIEERAAVGAAKPEAIGAQAAQSVEASVAKSAPGLDPAKSANPQAAGMVLDFAERLKTAENFGEVQNMLDGFKAEIAKKAKIEGLDKNAPILKAAQSAADDAVNKIALAAEAGPEVAGVASANKAFSQNATLQGMAQKSFTNGEFSPQKFIANWKKVKDSREGAKLSTEQVAAIDAMVKNPSALSALGDKLRLLVAKIAPDSVQKFAIPEGFRKPSKPGFYSPSESAELSPWMGVGGVQGSLADAYRQAIQR